MKKARCKFTDAILQCMTSFHLSPCSGIIPKFETDIQQKNPISKIHTGTKSSVSSPIPKCQLAKIKTISNVKIAWASLKVHYPKTDNSLWSIFVTF